MKSRLPEGDFAATFPGNVLTESVMVSFTLWPSELGAGGVKIEGISFEHSLGMFI